MRRPPPVPALKPVLTGLLGCIVLTIPTNVLAAGCGLGDSWQESESGFTSNWRREGDAGRFVADYTAPDGHRATTRNQVSLNGDAVMIRRLGSSDATMCTYSGTLSGNVISGSYACPSAWAGERPWHATVLCPAQTLTHITPPAAPRVAPVDPAAAFGDKRASARIASDASAIALVVLLRAAIGEIPGTSVDTVADQRAITFRSGAAPDLRGDLSRAGVGFMNFVADQIRRTSGSPGASNTSLVSSALQLRLAQDMLAEDIKKGVTPVRAISLANQILGQLAGRTNTVHFESLVTLTEHVAERLVDYPVPRRPMP